MPKSIDTQHSILIVSSSGQFDAIVSRSLTGYISKDICKSAAIARRFVLERYYDLVVINAPLPDENGEDLAMDVSENCNASILLVPPQATKTTAIAPERVMIESLLRYIFFKAFLFIYLLPKTFLSNLSNQKDWTCHYFQLYP